MVWHEITKATHLPFGFLGSLLCKSGERCCSFWRALLGDLLLGDPLEALCSGPWATLLAGGCLLGPPLCLWGSVWVLGGAWGLQGSGLSLPFCCSASLRLFSSSRFLEAKPRKKRKKIRTVTRSSVPEWDLNKRSYHITGGIWKFTFSRSSLFSKLYSSKMMELKRNLTGQPLSCWDTYDR